MRKLPAFYRVRMERELGELIVNQARVTGLTEADVIRRLVRVGAGAPGPVLEAAGLVPPAPLATAGTEAERSAVPAVDPVPPGFRVLRPR